MERIALLAVVLVAGCTSAAHPAPLPVYASPKPKKGITVSSIVRVDFDGDGTDE